MVGWGRVAALCCQSYFNDDRNLHHGRSNLFSHISVSPFARCISKELAHCTLLMMFMQVFMPVMSNFLTLCADRRCAALRNHTQAQGVCFTKHHKPIPESHAGVTMKSISTGIISTHTHICSHIHCILTKRTLRLKRDSHARV